LQSAIHLAGMIDFLKDIVSHYELIPRIILLISAAVFAGTLIFGRSTPERTHESAMTTPDSTPTPTSSDVRTGNIHSGRDTNINSPQTHNYGPVFNAPVSVVAANLSYHLGGEKQQALLAKLNTIPAGEVTFETAMDDRNAHQFAQSIGACFDHAGWKITEARAIGRPFNGIEVVALNPAQRQAAEFISKAFAELGLRNKLTVGTESAPHPISVAVGLD